MNRSRHVARPVSALRAVVWWAVPALGLAAAVLVYAGASVVPTVAGCAGLFAVLLVVYVLDRSGLMRPPPVQHRPPPALPSPQAPPPQPQPQPQPAPWQAPPGPAPATQQLPVQQPPAPPPGTSPHRYDAPPDGRAR